MVAIIAFENRFLFFKFSVVTELPFEELNVRTFHLSESPPNLSAVPNSHDFMTSQPDHKNLASSLLHCQVLNHTVGRVVGLERTRVNFFF